MLRMQVRFLISGQENCLCWGEGKNFYLSISLETMVNNCIAKWRLGAWDIQELPILITSQCSPEVLVAGIFASYSCLEHRLLLLDKTTENDSLFFWKTILSVAWICAWFGSAGYFTILADYFKICGEHCNQLLDCYSILHMSPHAGKGNKHLSHWIISGKREGRGGDNSLDDELSLQIINTESSCSKHIHTNEEHMEFQCTYAKNYWLL